MNIAKEIERDMKRKMKADKKEVIRLLKDLSGREIVVLLSLIRGVVESRRDAIRIVPLSYDGLQRLVGQTITATVIEEKGVKKIKPGSFSFVPSSRKKGKRNNVKR